MRWMMIGVVLGLALPATAQPQLNSKQRKRDAFSELNAKRKTQQGSDAGLALRFFDALTGDPLVGAKVSAGGESTRTNGSGTSEVAVRSHNQTTVWFGLASALCDQRC